MARLGEVTWVNALSGQNSRLVVRVVTVIWTEAQLAGALVLSESIASAKCILVTGSLQECLRGGGV